MPECKVCGGVEFGEEDGLFICIECHTVNEDLRVEVHEYKEAEQSQSQACTQHLASQVIKKKEKEENTSHVKILTSWETFNLCLKGLVTEMRGLGATPRLEAVVFKMWVDYLMKTEAAFISKKHKLAPRLPIKHWDSDAFLIYNTKKNKNLLLPQNRKKLGGKLKKRKLIASESEDEDSLAGSPKEGDESSVGRNSTNSRKRKRLKGDFFKSDYAAQASDVSVSVTDATALSSLTLHSYEPNISRPMQIVEKRDSFNVPALKRKHLLAFLYLACLQTQQSILLADILRWVEEGHLSYHKLSNFFPPTLAVLNDLKVFFVEQKSIPTYKVISDAAYELARLLFVRILPLQDTNSYIHRFCDEFNLPNQVALLSQRLMRLLPACVHDITAYHKLACWEIRAMAHVIVTLKIILGLDDTTEHENSKIASQMNELLRREGSSINLFVWDDWIRWSMLRSLALALYGKVTASPSPSPSLNTGLCQNVDAMLHFFQAYVPCFAHGDLRLKGETETMAEVLKRLSEDSYPCSSEGEGVSFPASLTPLATYTDTVVTNLRNGRMPSRNDQAWNSLVKNIHFTALLQDFRCKSIEYLSHPERIVDWAQQKGLAVGLRFGGGFQKCRKVEKAEISSFGNMNQMEFRTILTNKEKRKFKQSKAVRAGSRSVYLAAVTRPDTSTNGPLEPLKDLTDAVPQVCYGKHIEYTPPPAMSLAEADDADKFLCVPSTEYWTHLDNKNERPTSFNYLVMIAAKYLYTTEKALLEEIALVESLHKEFLGVNDAGPSRKKEW